LQAVVFCTLHDTESARLPERMFVSDKEEPRWGWALLQRGPLFYLIDGVQIWMTESVPGFHRGRGLVGITPVIGRG